MGVYSDRITNSPAGEPAVTKINAEVSPLSLNLSYFYSLPKPVNYVSLCYTLFCGDSKLLFTDNRVYFFWQMKKPITYYEKATKAYCLSVRGIPTY